MADVDQWLEALGLGQYAALFAENDVDLEVLPELTEHDLAELGISLGHRKKLLKAIASLDQNGDAAGLEEAPAAPLKPARASIVEAERRQLTVMFCDLVDSTALSERLDPEDLRDVIHAYQECCSDVIGRFDGYVAKFLGDGVLIYFGYPRAHEDDAVRAVRAGLDLVAAIDRLRPLGDLTIRSRIGIATGDVVVGDLFTKGASDLGAVVGETPNMAARLQGLAGSGSVVIARSTKRLLGGSFEYADLGEHQLKGFTDPVQVWRVLGESAAIGRFEARHGETLAPMVGREQELALLRERWARVTEGESQVVLMSGEPGIGKSRILLGLFEMLADEPHTRLRLYCSPYHVHTALHPFIDHLARAAGYALDDPPEVKLDKLEAMLGQATDQVDEAAALMAPLLSIPAGGRYPPLDLTPQQEKAKAFEVMIAQIAGLADRQPVLVIVEDAHWIDPTSIEFLDMVIGRLQHSPVMLVIAFRPTFKPPWTSHSHVTSLSLNRLGRDQAAAIIERLTGGKAFPPEVLDQIVAKTDGVPLFVEELTKTILESGLLAEQDNGYRLIGPLRTLRIPSTLQDSLMERLDRLDPGKEVAQIGAAIGREFYHELLAAAVLPLAEDELEMALNRLISAELIFRRGLPPNATYRFKHALVQDTAYNSLLRTRRQRLHREIAELLEQQFPQTVAAEPELLAHHYQEAGLAEQAIPYALQAGDAAAGRYASIEARARYQSVLEMAQSLPRAESATRSQIEATLKLASVAQNRQHFELDLKQLQRALTMAEELDDQQQLCRVHYWIGRTNYVLGRFDAGVRSAELSLHIAESLGSRDDDTSGPVNLLARLHCLRGEAQEAADFAARSLAQMHELGNRIEEAAVAGVLAFAYGLQGRFDDAFEAADRGVELAQKLDHLPTLAAAFHFRGVVHGWAGDLPDSEASFEQAIALCEQSGDLFRKYLAHGWRGEAYLIGDRVDAAAEDLTQCLALAEQIGTSFHRGAFQALLAKIRLWAGDLEEARRLSQEALAIASDSAQEWSRSIALQINAEVMLATDPPDVAGAEAAIQAAIAIQEQRACRRDLAWTHLASGHVFEAKGETGRASEAFATALQMFDEMGLTRGQTAARAALGTSEGDAATT